MIVYDDVAPLEKIRIFDARVERPPHYDTFGEFHYAYHYGDVYIPYLRQEEPLKVECQHFLDCIRTGAKPLSDGEQGRQLVEILEASSESLRRGGSPVPLPFQPNGEPAHNGRIAVSVVLKNGAQRNGRARPRTRSRRAVKPAVRARARVNP